MPLALVRIVETIIMPPLGPLLLMAVGALLLWARRRGGWTLFGFGWAGLYLISTPVASALLAGWLETFPAITGEQVRASGAGAIVVISADTYYRAPEYGASTSGHHELERVRYAAYLQRRTGLPIAVIGADIYGKGEDSSVWIRAILEQEFGATVRWATEGSFNTREDARRARDLLRSDLVDHIVLVTQAGHMPRAVWSFEREGFEVLAAPTGFYTHGWATAGFVTFLPSGVALYRNRLYLHELLGGLWYRWVKG